MQSRRVKKPIGVSTATLCDFVLPDLKISFSQGKVGKKNPEGTVDPFTKIYALRKVIYCFFKSASTIT